MDKTKFREELETLINVNGKELPSDTPDFILAEYLCDCLSAFDKAMESRKKWYGVPIIENKLQTNTCSDGHKVL